MPTIIRKSFPAIFETRREVLHAINWRVRSSVWSPPTDVYETEEAFVVRIEIAGMREEDFEVAMEAGLLTVSGVRPDINERRAFHQMEIWFGRFEIAIEIPVPIDVDASLAEYRDGFLVINLPRPDTKQLRVDP
jgi:HSP20 family protein